MFHFVLIYTWNPKGKSCFALTRGIPLQWRTASLDRTYPPSDLPFQVFHSPRSPTSMRALSVPLQEWPGEGNNSTKSRFDKDKIPRSNFMTSPVTLIF